MIHKSVKTVSWLTIVTVLLVSCSANSLDPAKYYVATEKMPLIDSGLENYDVQDIEVEVGEKVMLVQDTPYANNKGYIQVVTDTGHDFGIVQLKKIKKTALPILFPRNTVFSNNTSAIFYVRNYNSSSDSTIDDKYKLLCIFPAATSRMLIRNETGDVVQEKKYADYNGYKYDEIEIDTGSRKPGNYELLVVAYDRQNQIIGTRPFSLRKDDLSSIQIVNNQLDSFRYRKVRNEITIERFFGFIENDEDVINYKPDFNTYEIDGTDGYSYSVGIELDKTKKRRSDMPLTFRVLGEGREMAEIDLRQYELTPSGDEMARIIEYPEFVVIYCTPPFEGPSRVVVCNKKTARMYDIWSLLKTNGISESHSSFTVSVDTQLKIEEVPFRFDYSENPYREYTVDLNTDRIIHIRDLDDTGTR